MLGEKLRLQIYVRKDAWASRHLQLYKLLDLGDHIGVDGISVRTRTGELTRACGDADVSGEGDAGDAG